MGLATIGTFYGKLNGMKMELRASAITWN